MSSPEWLMWISEAFRCTVSIIDHTYSISVTIRSLKLEETCHFIRCESFKNCTSLKNQLLLPLQATLGLVIESSYFVTTKSDWCHLSFLTNPLHWSNKIKALSSFPFHENPVPHHVFDNMTVTKSLSLMINQSEETIRQSDQ